MNIIEKNKELMKKFETMINTADGMFAIIKPLGLVKFTV